MRVLIATNSHGFAPTFFDHIAGAFPDFLNGAQGMPKAEFLIPTLVDELIRSGRIEVEVPQTPEHWLGVTYPEDKPLVQAGVAEFIARGRYPADLWGDG